MLMDRIIGALTFRRSVYQDVEGDPSFTTTAWALVAVVAFLNQLGVQARSNVGNWILSAIIGTIFTVIGFALAVFVIQWVGARMFNAQVNFDEMVRTLGLAYVWNIVGFIGILAAFSPALACVLSPALFLGWLLGLAAWLIAAKEALDLEWVPTIVTVVLGYLVIIIINFLVGLILGILGISAAAVGNLF